MHPPTADPNKATPAPLMTDPALKSRPPIRVLFVCLGNICRSPVAEGVFVHLCREAGVEARFHVDSAGTGSWHVGEAPDARVLEVASRRGISLRGHARSVRPEDLAEFDLILAMDRENLRNLEKERARFGGSARIALLREFDPEPPGDLDVPDPYYGGPGGFDLVFEMVHRSCGALLEELLNPQNPVERPPASPGRDDP